MLSIVNQNGKLVVDSREVARMLGKEHRHLLRDIQSYVQILGKNAETLATPSQPKFGLAENPSESNFGLAEKPNESKIGPADFFIQSTYSDEQGKPRPCYLLTRKGCDMVANKMTGEKGVLFTAAYVTQFDEMEKRLQKPQSSLDILEATVRALREMETRQQEQSLKLDDVTRKVESIGNTIAINPNGWRKSTHDAIVKIAQVMGGNQYIVDVQRDIYRLMKERFGFDVKRRLSNRRARLMLNGSSATEVKKLNYLDVIASDKRAVEAYVQIVREMCIHYGVELVEAAM